MRRKFSKAMSTLLAGVLCVTTVCGANMLTFAENLTSDGFQIEDYQSGNLNGYRITGITSDAVREGSVTIPDEINRKPVILLGDSQSYTFLGRNNVTNLHIGKNVKGTSTHAFFGAKDLESITIDESNRSLLFNEEQGYLYSTGGLTKYLSTNEKTSFTFDLERGNKIYNMDHAEFETLDLGTATEVLHLSFAGSEIDTLLPKNAQLKNDNHDILYGAFIDSFDASGSSIYQTRADGKMLLDNQDRLIKIAVNADLTEDDFRNIESISPYAFNSLAEYQMLSNILPENLIKDVVFSFFHQDEGVFMLNGEISFCYNYDKKVPTMVDGNAVDYSSMVTKEQEKKIQALMYVGVPYNKTGVFEEVFGENYEDIASDVDETQYGNAALNIVSALIYKTLNGYTPAEIKGIGHGIFTPEKVNEYQAALETAIRDYQKYNFSPEFALKDNTIRFNRSGNGYESEPFTVKTIDGEGTPVDTYKYNIRITTPGLTVKNGENHFYTGESIVLVSEEKPVNISMEYSEPTLKYYRTGDTTQDILMAAEKFTPINLDVTVTVNDLSISKYETGKDVELSGAELVLYKDGTIVKTWPSGNPLVISDPEDGIYTLHEASAPDGYELAADIIFEIKDGKVITAGYEDGKIIMYDDPITEPDRVKISISKQDVTTGKELPGAELTLTRLDETTDEPKFWTWISTQEPHIIYDIEDGTYELVENQAPNGYEIAESIEFEVKDGEVVGGPVVMYDEPSPKTIAISKVDAATGKELPGAKLILNRLDGNSDEVKSWSWVSGNTPHIITDIQDGLYELIEITAPAGYEIAESIEFEVKNGEVVGGPIIMEDEPKSSTPSEPDEPSKPDPEPEKPTPSEPDKPEEPDEPSKPSKPSTDGGFSGGGGNTPNTPDKPPVNQTPDKPVEKPVTEKPDTPTPTKTIPQTLPKTNDIASAGIISLAALCTLFFVYRRYGKEHGVTSEKMMR